MVSKLVGGEAWYNFMIKSWSFNRSVSLGCDVYSVYVLVWLFALLGGTGKLERAGAGCLPFS